MILAGTAIISAICILAFPFFAWLIFVREPALEAEERIREKAERDIQKATRKLFDEKQQRGRREAA